jgi:hypothetical protein
MRESGICFKFCAEFIYCDTDDVQIVIHQESLVSESRLIMLVAPPIHAVQVYLPYISTFFDV